MKRHWGLRVLKILAIALVALLVAGAVSSALWNALMPSIFGLRTITFWQALGLLLLGRLFFGGFRGGPGRRMHWRRRMQERWAQMSPEEREKFMQGMKACNPHQA